MIVGMLGIDAAVVLGVPERGWYMVGMMMNV